MKKKVVTLGEIMLRLSPPGHERFLRAQNYNAFYGGGEANVAASLSQYGHDAYFVTKLPENDIGQSAINSLKQSDVKTDYIIRGGDRIGIYFSETGASMRPSKVIYDRANSSFAKAKVEEFDFSKIFKDTEIFHISGITPAISDTAREIALESVKAGKKAGCTISLDYNYRSKLWTREEHDEAIKELLPYVDILLGYIPGGVNWETGEVDHSEVEKSFKEFLGKYDLKLMTSTIRNSISASDNELYAVMHDGEKYYKSNTYKINVVNRIGGGDAFAAGFLSELLYKSTHEQALEFAVAASSWKHTIYTDHNIATRDEIIEVAKGNVSGSVQR